MKSKIFLFLIFIFCNTVYANDINTKTKDIQKCLNITNELVIFLQNEVSKDYSFCEYYQKLLEYANSDTNSEEYQIFKNIVNEFKKKQKKGGDRK